MATITKIRFETEDFNRATGGNIDATVTFSEDVNIGGVPVLTLTNDNNGPGDGRVQHLEYNSMLAPNEALFRIALGPNAVEAPSHRDTLTVGANALSLNSGFIKNLSDDQDADITNSAEQGTAAGRVPAWIPA